MFSYAEVDGLSGRVAEFLVRLGLEPGDKVAVQLPNVPEFVLAYFGILKAGLAMMPLNPLLTAPEIGPVNRWSQVLRNSGVHSVPRRMSSRSAGRFGGRSFAPGASATTGGSG